MRRAHFVCLFHFFAVAFVSAQLNSAPSPDRTAQIGSPNIATPVDAGVQARIRHQYDKLPLTFEANHGQAGADVKFLSRSSGQTLYLTNDAAILIRSGRRAKTTALEEVNPSELRMKLRNADPAATVTGLDEQPGRSNYFIGNDPANWQSNVPTYAKVKYTGVYPGVDLIYYGNQRQLEYDFIVAPAADPSRIEFEIQGAENIRRDANGDLVFRMNGGMTGGDIRWQRPFVYQRRNGKKEVVAARYAVKGANRVGFALAKYDPTQPLYIDPLIYSTYLGGSGEDFAYGVAVDSAGNAYVTGQAFSPDFPTTPGALLTFCVGKNSRRCYNFGEAFITKINPAGSALVYSTFLGGSGGDVAASIAVDSAGDVYVTGQTYSSNFPTTAGAFQRVCASPCSAHGDPFITKLNPQGSALIYSTYLGGSGTDWGGSIAVDPSGNAYITGQTSSTDFPATTGAFQAVCGDVECGSGDAFVAKLNSAGSALVYSTYLGGDGLDFGRGIAVDKAGNAYVTGGTLSTDFPTTPTAFQTFCGDVGCSLGDAFVTKLNPAGSALVYSTYLGGSDYEIGTAIAADSAGNAYVVGGTGSPNFPTEHPVQAVYAGGGDAFVTALNSKGTALIYSTYLGGTAEDNANGVAVDSADNVYVTGNSSSADFPIMKPVQAANSGYSNAFAARLNSTGNLSFSTYLGGLDYDIATAIATDAAGNAYVVGATDSTKFRTRKPLQAVNNGGFDAFVAKIQIAAATTTTLSSSLNPAVSGQGVTFTAVVVSPNGPPPNGETVTFMQNQKMLGMAILNGGTARFTISTLSVGTHSIKAVYGGDPNFAGSASPPVQQVVNP